MVPPPEESRKKMKKYTLNITAAMLFALVTISPALVGSSCVAPKGEQEDTASTAIKKDLGITALKYSSPEVPVSVIFCWFGTVPMHSTSLQMIKKANRYFPIVEPILKENGIPDDFKYLMVIESNLNPIARSSAGAAGLWQFMQGTGRDYGLEVNSNIDERYHVEKATRAACRYLKDAYAKYKDWVAVAASYNAGQARIASQLAKQDVDDSLDLQLVEETARYVYRILAAKIMFSDPTAFGFRLRASDLYPAIPYTEITVTEGIANLARFARSKGITLAILKNMNPWLRETSLANHSKRTYKLKIPTKEGMYYNPQTVVPHDKRWVVE